MSFCAVDLWVYSNGSNLAQKKEKSSDCSAPFQEMAVYGTADGEAWNNLEVHDAFFPHSFCLFLQIFLLSFSFIYDFLKYIFKNYITYSKL